MLESAHKFNGIPNSIGSLEFNSFGESPLLSFTKKMFQTTCVILKANHEKLDFPDGIASKYPIGFAPFIS